MKGTKREEKETAYLVKENDRSQDEDKTSLHDCVVWLDSGKEPKVISITVFTNESQ
jgi:uncharacterized protein YuzE